MGSGMKNYHGILEVPKDATKEQIRARYKQLVRIFHPDRYSDPKDKEFVEERMREINEAYNALMNPTRAMPREGNEALPQPVVLPPNGLDFGKLPWGSDQTLTFHVGNVGGNVRRFKLSYSEENSWFRVTEGSRVHPNKQFPLRFGVAVDTHALEPGQNYHGWIDINMDDVTTRINLHVHVVTMRAFVWLTPRVATVLGLLLLGLIFALPQMLDFNTPIFSQNRPAATSSIAWQQEQSSDADGSQRSVAVGPRLSSGSESSASGKPASAVDSGPQPAVAPAVADQPPTDLPVDGAAEPEDNGAEPDNGAINGDTPTPTAQGTPSATATSTPRTPADNKGGANENGERSTATLAFLTSQPTAIPIEPPGIARTATVTATEGTQVAAPTTAAPTETETSAPTATDTATAPPTNTATNTPTAAPTSTATATHTSTATTMPTSTATATHTSTATEAPTATPVDTPTLTPPTATSTATATSTNTATNTPVPTATETPRPTDTMTPRPTSTETSTQTPAPTPTQTSTSTPDFGPYGIFVAAPSGQQVSVHSDIFVESDVILLLDSEERLAATGRTFDNLWIHVRLTNGQAGWVVAERVLIDSAQLETLPITAPDSFN